MVLLTERAMVDSVITFWLCFPTWELFSDVFPYAQLQIAESPSWNWKFTWDWGTDAEPAEKAHRWGHKTGRGGWEFCSLSKKNTVYWPNTGWTLLSIEQEIVAVTFLSFLWLHPAQQDKDCLSFNLSDLTSFVLKPHESSRNMMEPPSVLIFLRCPASLWVQRSFLFWLPLICSFSIFWTFSFVVKHAQSYKSLVFRIDAVFCIELRIVSPLAFLATESMRHVSWPFGQDKQVRSRGSDWKYGSLTTDLEWVQGTQKKGGEPPLGFWYCR